MSVLIYRIQSLLHQFDFLSLAASVVRLTFAIILCSAQAFRKLSESNLGGPPVRLGISNRNFKERSGTNDLKLDDNRFQPVLKRWYNNFSISSEFRYRCVVHNTMLEGFGWGKTWEGGPYDDESLTKYKLRNNEICRNLWTWEVFARLRFKKVSIY